MKIQDMRVKVESDSQMRIAMTLLQEISGLSTSEASIASYVAKYPVMSNETHIGITEGRIASWSYSSVSNISFADFVIEAAKIAFAPKPAQVKLNDEYTAEITKGGTVVGCQTFQNSKILEVAEKIKELQ